MWRIPWTGEPGGLESIGSHRVDHDWSNLAATATSVEWINETKHIPLQNHRGRKTSKNLFKKKLHSKETWQMLPQPSDQLTSWKVMLTLCMADKRWWGQPFTFPVFFQKIHNLHLILRKTSDKSYLRDLLQNPWVVLLKTVNVIKTKKRVRNCHSQEESKETGWLIMVWYSRWGPTAQKRTLGKKRRHVNMRRQVNKVWTSVNNNITVSVH